jgi:hypothetical protein
MVLNMLLDSMLRQPLAGFSCRRDLSDAGRLSLNRIELSKQREAHQQIRIHIMSGFVA